MSRSKEGMDKEKNAATSRQAESRRDRIIWMNVSARRGRLITLLAAKAGASFRNDQPRFEQEPTRT